MSGKDWRDVIAVTDLEENWVTRVEVGRRMIAVYDSPGGVYASLALCNHGGADLCDGYFDGHVIECPLHQGAFDVRSSLTSRNGSSRRRNSPRSTGTRG